MAASWAGAAARAVERGFFRRVLRTLGGKNIGKCRLRVHQHPLSPPLSILLEPAPMQTSKAKTRAGVRDGTRAGGCSEGLCWWFVLKMGYSLHRFLILGPNLRIAARFSPETAQRLHRFLISGPDLRIDARFSPFMPSCVHRFLNSSPDLRIDARFSPETAQRLHRFLISCPDLRIDARFVLS